MTSPDSTAIPPSDRSATDPHHVPPSHNPPPPPYPPPSPYAPPFGQAMPVYPQPAAYVPMAVPYYMMPPQPRNGLGLASVILGPIGLLPSLFTLIPIIGVAYAIFAIPIAGTGLGLGIAGLRRVHTGVATNGGAAKTGLWFSAIDLGLVVLGIVIAIVVSASTSSTSDCVPVQGYPC